MDAADRSTYWRQHQTQPFLWVVSAERSAYAARVLFQRSSEATKNFLSTSPPSGQPEALHLQNEMSLNFSAFMLAGFAMENMLKALLIAKMNSEAPICENDPRFKKLTTKASAHDLVWLANEANVQIDSNEIDTLKTLTEFIYWVGRYPRPTQAERLMPDDPTNPDALKLPIMSDHAWTIFEKLYADVHDRVNLYKEPV